jgi:hypothetical protein
MHSNACFRKLSDSDMAHLFETPMLNHCTASRVLSVVYTTEKNRNNTGCARTQEVTALWNPNRNLVGINGGSWQILLQKCVAGCCEQRFRRADTIYC